jgi:hypothetical protein
VDPLVIATAAGFGWLAAKFAEGAAAEAGKDTYSLIRDSILVPAQGAQVRNLESVLSKAKEIGVDRMEGSVADVEFVLQNARYEEDGGVQALWASLLCEAMRGRTRGGDARWAAHQLRVLTSREALALAVVNGDTPLFLLSKSPRYPTEHLEDHDLAVLRVLNGFDLLAQSGHVVHKQCWIGFLEWRSKGWPAESDVPPELAKAWNGFVRSLDALGSAHEARGFPGCLSTLKDSVRVLESTGLFEPFIGLDAGGETSPASSGRVVGGVYDLARFVCPPDPAHVEGHPRVLEDPDPSAVAFRSVMHLPLAMMLRWRPPEAASASDEYGLGLGRLAGVVHLGLEINVLVEPVDREICVEYFYLTPSGARLCRAAGISRSSDAKNSPGSLTFESALEVLRDTVARM